MDFITVSFILAFFLFMVGSLLLVWSYRVPLAKGFFTMRHVLGFLGVFFLAISVISALIGSGQSLYFSNLAPCENVVNSSVYISNITTQYTYVDSCTSRTIPSSAENLYVIFLYLVGLIIILSFIGAIFGLVWVFKKW
jgi:hypothetical protein